MPIAAVRHAGFPMELLEPLTSSAVAAAAEKLRGNGAELAAQAARLREVLRSAGGLVAEVPLAWVGQLRPLPDAVVADLAERLSAPALRAVTDYQDATERLAGAWDVFARGHQDHLQAARSALVDIFQDERLRAVLLLSNDAHYAEYDAWLRRGPVAAGSRRDRRMADLLTMYLQRVTTKNETHAHFGPIAVAIVDPTASGLAWTSGAAPERRVYFAHWAAERLSEVAGALPGLRESVRPRRRPLAFCRDGRLELYTFAQAGTLWTDWRFGHLASVPVTQGERWLWDRCDGATPLRALRESWLRNHNGAAAADFGRCLSQLVASQVLVADFEIPVGIPSPLRALASELAAAEGEAAVPALALVQEFEDHLDRLLMAEPAQRPAVLAALKERFQQVTGTAPNRFAGQHYADRSVVFEEAHSQVRQLRIGADIAGFLARDLSLFCELAMTEPRLRQYHESEVLLQWFTGHFGIGRRVPLGRVYDRFFADQQALADACAAVDARISDFRTGLAEVLLGDADTSAHEVAVPRDRLHDFLAGYPADVPTLCNPDVMLAAESAEAVSRGDFLTVVGDCHALRELLSHSSYSPLLEERAPRLAEEILRHYRSVVQDDEILVDLVRGHSDKSATQLELPCPDLEFFGRSGKSRDHVVQPRDLYLTVRDGRLELRSDLLGGRVRLLAPPAGRASIREDPLTPFSFPRRYGGLLLPMKELHHVPRIRSGRVVLQRELWRVPAARLRAGPAPTRSRRHSGAAEFAAAAELRYEFGLPRHVFASIPGEPKPVYVDWRSPLLVHQLFRLARSASGPVEFSEMLPAPSHRWLRHSDERFTSEIRCAVFRRPGGYS